MAETLEVFNNVLQLAVENGASDVHIKTDHPAFIRLHGKLEEVEMEPLDREGIREFIDASCPLEFLDRWRRESQIDYAYFLPGAGRFRVSAFLQRGVPSIVFRHVKSRPPSLKELNHEEELLLPLCNFHDGILLVCGPTGSGKSTTCAALLEWINNNQNKHIVTLEDPIEYTFTDRQCIFNQREVGIDTKNFAAGMRAVLRQDPDIIFVGEMRDAETFETAMRAAETGHLVFGTLHSGSAQQAVQRLYEFFPAEQQEGIRRQIAGTLRATVTQRLIPALEGDGLVPTTEIFKVDALGRKILEEGTYEKIPAVIEAGKDTGSKTFNTDLLRLVKAGLVSRQDALRFSPNPQALDMNLKGIFLSTGGIVT